MYAKGRSSARNDVLVAVATAVFLAIEFFAYGSLGSLPRVEFRIVEFLMASTFLGLSVAGGFCTVRAIFRMSSFGGLLILPVLLVHLFFFYFGVASLIGFAFPPPGPRHIHQGQASAANRMFASTSRLVWDENG